MEMVISEHPPKKNIWGNFSIHFSMVKSAPHPVANLPHPLEESFGQKSYVILKNHAAKGERGGGHVVKSDLL